MIGEVILEVKEFYLEIYGVCWLVLILLLVDLWSMVLFLGG